MKEEATLGGIYDFNARFYDPAIGRFLSADTMVPQPSDPQSLNRFSFVRNNPLKYVDPSGHCFTLNAFGLSISLFCKGQEGNQPTIFDGDPDSFGGENDLTIYDGPGSFGNDDGVQILDGDPGSFSNDGSPQILDGDPGSFGKDSGAQIFDGNSDSFENGIKNSVYIFTSKKYTDEDKNRIVDGIQGRVDDNLLDPPTERGRPPTFIEDGTSVEIHHLNQQKNGPFVELHWEDHRGKGNHRSNHLNRNSEIDRELFEPQKRRYWESEWDRGRWGQ